MAVLRQFNFVSQARFDVPHGRLLESAVAGDFDALAGYIMSGKQPLVVTGFSLDPSGVGTNFDSLKVLVAGSAVLHFGASESGTIYTVPAGVAPEALTATNANVSGSAVNGTDNFIGLDIVRVIDDSTRDRVAFLDAGTNVETSRSVPLGRTLKYRFVISTRTFSSTPNVLPIAIATVNASGIVTQITDARKMMFRLGSGGDSPNPLATFLFSARKDGAASTTTAATNPFIGGDKDIPSLKAWQDAMMTRLWEIGGGEYWYSQTAFQDVSMSRDFTVAFPAGDNFEVVAGNVHWRGLRFAFANSTATSNLVADQTTDSVGLTDLAVGECVYVDLDRSTDGATLTAHKTSLLSLGTSARPGSRIILAWRTAGGFYARGVPYTIGTVGVPVATPAILGIVKLASSYTVDAAHPEVPTMDATSATGTLAQVLAGGLTRGTTTPGNISIGTGANDQTVHIGRVGQTTSVDGSLGVAGTVAVTGGSTVGGTLGVTGATTLSGGATVTGTMTAGTVNVTAGYQLGGAAVSLFPVGYGTCRYLFSGPGGQTATVTGSPPGWLDLSAFGVFGFQTAGVGATVNTSDGSITVTNAGTYLVSHSVGIGSPLTADGIAIMVSTRVLQNSVDVTLGANGFALNTGGNSWHFGICSGSGVFTAAAGTVFKLQVTSGAGAGTGNIMVNSVAFTVTRIA